MNFDVHGQPVGAGRMLPLVDYQMINDWLGEKRQDERLAAELRAEWEQLRRATPKKSAEQKRWEAAVTRKVNQVLEAAKRQEWERKHETD